MYSIPYRSLMWVYCSPHDAKSSVQLHHSSLSDLDTRFLTLICLILLASSHEWLASSHREQSSFVNVCLDFNLAQLLTEPPHVTSWVSNIVHAIFKTHHTPIERTTLPHSLSDPRLLQPAFSRRWPSSRTISRFRQELHNLFVLKPNYYIATSRRIPVPS